MAAKTIKGITVEIGGDTTGLGKALKEVEKQASGLDSNLKAVNKALQLDPTNTILLAEKQKILADAVEATKEKLKTLEDVQEQIAEQYANGEIGQTAYVDFQKELVYTKSKLEDLERQQKEFGDTVDSVANGELENFNETLRDTDEAAEEAGDGFTVAKGAIADFISDTVQTATGLIRDLIGEMLNLAEATEEFQMMQAKLAGSADTFGYSVGFATGEFQNFYKYLSDDQAATNAITNLMGLQVSTESLSKLANAAISVWTAYGDSIPIESLTESINETAQVAQVTGVLADALNWAGISEDAFNKQLEACNSTQERANLIAATLNNTYAVSKERYDALNGSILENNEAEQKLAATEAQLGEAMRPVNTALTELKAELLTAFLPLLTELASGAASVLGWLKEHPTVLYAVVGAVIALAAAFGILAVAMAIQGVIAMVSGGFVGLSAAMAALPYLAIAAGIAAIVGSLIYLGTHLEDLKSMWTDFWGSLKSDYQAGQEAIAISTQESMNAQVTATQDFWANIRDTWKRGNEMIATETHAAHAEQVTELQSFWANTQATWQAGNSAILSGTHASLNAQVTAVQDFFSNMLSRITTWGSNMRSKATSAIENMRSAISSGLDRIRNLFNFEWSLPHIRLPHFYVSGQFSLNPPQVPSFGVQWYAKGAILDGAQIFGRMGNTLLGGGEAGKEAVLPLSSFYSELRSILGSYMRSPADSSDMIKLFNKLDGIYEKLGRLQVVLDTGTLVGETIDKFDAAFAEKQMLEARGV